MSKRTTSEDSSPKRLDWAIFGISIILALLTCALWKISTLGGAISIALSVFFVMLFGLRVTNPYTVRYRIFSEVLFVMGTAWFGGAAMQYKFWQGDYWVFVIAGMLTILLGAYGKDRAGMWNLINTYKRKRT